METNKIQNNIDHDLLISTVDGNGNDYEKEEEETNAGARREAADSADYPTLSDFQNEMERPAEVASSPTHRSAFAKVEKSLASLGFFTPSSRRIKNQKLKRVGFTREIDGKRVEVSAEIHPSAMFGLPVTADQDKYLALQKIITNMLQEQGKVTNPIRFKSSELLRLLNTSTQTGQNYKAISEWLDVMSATTIISDGAVYVSGQKRFARDRFRVFDRALSFGKELDDGTVADANYVWLSAWQLENINNKFLVPIDLETYRELKNHIAKALVPLLQIWLFASHKAEAFEKRYSELCEILTLQTYKAPSQILRQFEPSLDELVLHGYIEKWRIEKASDKKSYKVIFFHGPKFYRDRRKRIEQKNHAEPRVVIGEFEGVETRVPEPGKVEVIDQKPVMKATEQPSTEPPAFRDVPDELVDELSARALVPSVVLKLLSSLSPERLADVSDYIEYWDEVGKSTKVGPGFLYDLIKNGDSLPASFETKRQRADRLAAEERRRDSARAEEKCKADYEEHIRQTVDRFIAEDLPAGEFERRVTEYKEKTASQSGFWSERPDVAEQFAQHAVRAEISKEINLPTFDDFRRRESTPVVAVSPMSPQNLAASSLEPQGSQESIQNAISAPQSDAPPKVEVFHTTDQSSSLRADLGL